MKAYAEVDGQVFQVMARGVAGGCGARVMGRGCGRVRVRTGRKAHPRFQVRTPDGREAAS